MSNLIELECSDNNLSGSQRGIGHYKSTPAQLRSSCQVSSKSVSLNLYITNHQNSSKPVLTPSGHLASLCTLGIALNNTALV